MSWDGGIGDRHSLVASSHPRRFVPPRLRVACVAAGSRFAERLRAPIPRPYSSVFTLPLTHQSTRRSGRSFLSRATPASVTPSASATLTVERVLIRLKRSSPTSVIEHLNSKSHRRDRKRRSAVSPSSETRVAPNERSTTSAGAQGAVTTRPRFRSRQAKSVRAASLSRGTIMKRR